MPLRNRPPRRSKHVAPVSQFFSPLNFYLPFFSWIGFIQLSALTIFAYQEELDYYTKDGKFNRCLNRKRGIQESAYQSLRFCPFGRSRLLLLLLRLSGVTWSRFLFLKRSLRLSIFIFILELSQNWVKIYDFSSSNLAFPFTNVTQEKLRSASSNIMVFKARRVGPFAFPLLRISTSSSRKFYKEW